MKRRFLISYGPHPQIICCGCGKSTCMVAARGGEVTERDTAHYKRCHVCGPSDGPWDLDQGGQAS